MPERTGCGHGSRLLQAVADTLVQDGFHTVVTWAIEADTALLRFLESSGWAADGARGELDVGTSVPVVRLHTSISDCPGGLGPCPRICAWLMRGNGWRVRGPGHCPRPWCRC